MRYDFLVDTYATERLKVLSTWNLFGDGDLPVRPRDDDSRGRSVLEQMVHQCVSEDIWFRTMLGIDVQAPPLPEHETRSGFVARYGEDSAARFAAIQSQEPSWWEAETDFFEVRRTRAWVMVRRIAHTAHHRGQQAAVLRMLGRDLYSTYGPTADTGGLMQDQAPTIYAFRDEAAILAGEPVTALPVLVERAVTERPDG
jgi:uncharacterized damage-inducible protein DinB